jgi:hypothetical protein
VIILQGDIALRPNKSFKFTAGVWGHLQRRGYMDCRGMTAVGSISASGIYTAPSAPAVMSWRPVPHSPKVM